MGLFEILMGGGQKRQEYEDFARRYEQGPPSEGYSDREVLDRYGEVAHKLPSTDYEAAVRDALARLSPAEQAAASAGPARAYRRPRSDAPQVQPERRERRPR